MSIRVLLVDDHAMIRMAFRTILDAQADIEVVGEAATGQEAIDAASHLRPDVICMDVQMPDMNGIEATRRIVADAAVEAAIAIVTTFDRDDYLFAALEAGASGFLLKNAGPEDLVTAVRVIAGGDAMLAPEMTRRVLTRFSEAAPAPAVAAAPSLEPAEPFTDRESEVLALMADALSNAEIGAKLYIGEATVKTHVSRILQKLGARDRVQAIVLALRHGLVRA